LLRRAKPIQKAIATVLGVVVVVATVAIFSKVTADADFIGH
jgi:hypothetical protein